MIGLTQSIEGKETAGPSENHASICAAVGRTRGGLDRTWRRIWTILGVPHGDAKGMVAVGECRAAVNHTFPGQIGIGLEGQEGEIVGLRSGEGNPLRVPGRVAVDRGSRGGFGPGRAVGRADFYAAAFGDDFFVAIDDKVNVNVLSSILDNFKGNCISADGIDDDRRPPRAGHRQSRRDGAEGFRNPQQKVEGVIRSLERRA